MAEYMVSVSGLQSRSFRYPNRYLDLFLGSPEFKFLATLVNSQPVCVRPVGILNNVMSGTSDSGGWGGLSNFKPLQMTSTNELSLA